MSSLHSALSGSLSLTVLFSLLPAICIVYCISLTIYRIYFHPLSKYPGPLLAKITDLYQTYHALIGDRHLNFYQNHEKYGEIYRFGPNSLSFNTATALKEIYGHRSNVQKAPFYKAFWATKDSASTHSSIDKSIHARKRRVLSHAFSDAAIKSMENHILAHIRQFCSNLLPPQSPIDQFSASDEKGFAAPVEISDQANFLTFDIMGDLCFGKAFGMLEHPANRFAIDLIGNAAHRHLICGTYLPIHTYHLDKLFFRKIAAGRARYMAYSKSQAAERMKTGLDVSRKDFFYYLLKAKDPETGHGFTTPELWGESNLLIIAGSDTTSTALAATIFYLCHNPSTLAHLTSLVRSTFSAVEDITISPHLTSLAYLRACIDEAMRLSPSVGGLLPREVLPGGLTLTHPSSSSSSTLHIPAGTIVGVPHYSIHHNATYFPSPFAFRPERWLDGGITGVENSAFCPFSVGPRGCIGKGMAYAELSVTIARMLWLYDLKVAEGEGKGDGEFRLKDTFTSMKSGPWVRFRRRQDGVVTM